jgi:hypothetical protein
MKQNSLSLISETSTADLGYDHGKSAGGHVGSKRKDSWYEVERVNEAFNRYYCIVIRYLSD